MDEAKKWEKQIKEFKNSGKSQRVWCREQGIKRSTLRYWLERTNELLEGTEVRFARIVIGGELGDSDSTV